MKYEKSCIAIIFTLLFMCTVLLFGVGIQTSRLQSSMEQLECYRTELTAAHNRQSEITGIVTRTGEILSTTANSITELRKQIQEIEDCYNQLWEHCYGLDTTTNY